MRPSTLANRSTRSSTGLTRKRVGLRPKPSPTRSRSSPGNSVIGGVELARDPEVVQLAVDDPDAAVRRHHVEATPDRDAGPGLTGPALFGAAGVVDPEVVDPHRPDEGVDRPDPQAVDDQAVVGGRPQLDSRLRGHSSDAQEVRQAHAGLELGSVAVGRHLDVAEEAESLEQIAAAHHGHRREADLATARPGVDLEPPGVAELELASRHMRVRRGDQADLGEDHDRRPATGGEVDSVDPHRLGGHEGVAQPQTEVGVARLERDAVAPGHVHDHTALVLRDVGELGHRPQTAALDVEQAVLGGDAAGSGGEPAQILGDQVAGAEHLPLGHGCDHPAGSLARWRRRRRQSEHAGGSEAGAADRPHRDRGGPSPQAQPQCVLARDRW